jgi:uncharacterized protein YciI
MKFAAIIEYTTDRDKIQSVRPVHRQYLAQLKARANSLHRDHSRMIAVP